MVANGIVSNFYSLALNFRLTFPKEHIQFLLLVQTNVPLILFYQEIKLLPLLRNHLSILMVFGLQLYLPKRVLPYAHFFQLLRQ